MSEEEDEESPRRKSAHDKDFVMDSEDSGSDWEEGQKKAKVR